MYVIARSVSDDAILLMAGLLRFARNDVCVECSPQANSRGIDGARDSGRRRKGGGRGMFLYAGGGLETAPLS